MPRLKPSKLEERQRVVRGLISKNMEFKGIATTDELGTKSHILGRTLRNKIRAPETFTLAELWGLTDALDMSGEERAMLLGKEIKFELCKVAN